MLRSDDRSSRADEIRHDRSRARLFRERDRILEIENQRIGAAPERLGELPLGIPGDEEQRAHRVRPRARALNS